jgi:acetolactate synthase I/II/III large subunit
MDGVVVRENGAQALVQILENNKVGHAFCVPGESYLAVLDALRDADIALTVCRNEGGAAMMAEAVGKATGRPGVCFVTRGPGAANAAAGVFVAHHDSTPMILFVGQVERKLRGRDAFQEMDYVSFFEGIAKYVVEIDDAERVEEFVTRALQIAVDGRPGPVVVSLPKDMLTDPCPPIRCAPVKPVEPAPQAEAMTELAAAVAAAARPIFILGGTRWDAASVANFRRFAENFQMPVATSYRRSWLFDQLHPCYAGDLGLGADPKLVARIRRSDLVVLAGGRLGEIPSQGFNLLDMPRPQMKFIHAHADSAELGRLYQADLSIQTAPGPLAAGLAAFSQPDSIPWRQETAQAHADYLEWSGRATAQPGGVNLGEIMIWLRENLPSDAIICNGAGNYAAWIHRFYRFRQFATHIAPTSATMGYGVPAAVAMKRVFPQRMVVGLAGDGDFLMNGQEFATAVQYGLPIVLIICDNASYGTIRMHQEREYPARVVATDLRNPDFAAYARAFGGFGVRVERTERFEEAFQAAVASGLPSIIHLDIDTRAITPASSLDDIRARSLAQGARSKL